MKANRNPIECDCNRQLSVQLSNGVKQRPKREKGMNSGLSESVALIASLISDRNTQSIKSNFNSLRIDYSNPL